MMYFGRTIPGLLSQDLLQRLDELDVRLALLRANFTDQDDSIDD